MITLNIRKQHLRSVLPLIQINPLLVLLIPIVLLLLSFPYWIYNIDPTTALPDPGIWSLVLLALTVFLLLLLLCWYLFTRIWKCLGLPSIENMALQFMHLELWQQFLLYWMSLALVMLVAVGCLVAIF